MIMSMTSNLIAAHFSLALSALVPASASAAGVAVDHPYNGVRAPVPARHVVHPTPLVSLTPSSVKLRAERTDAGVSLALT
jgi:hypothetical protein